MNEVEFTKMVLMQRKETLEASLEIAENVASLAQRNFDEAVQRCNKTRDMLKLANDALCTFGVFKKCNLPRFCMETRITRECQLEHGHQGSHNYDPQDEERSNEEAGAR